MGLAWLVHARRDRQAQDEGRAVPRHRVEADRPPMLPHDDAAREREPLAGALADRLRREERLEHVRLGLEGNARAVVGEAEFDLLAVAARGHANQAGAVRCREWLLADRLGG